MKLPEHKAGLTLSHNDHKSYYQSPEDFIEENENLYSWFSEEHKQRAVATNSIWTLQWYPDTPVGFYAIAAPTLEELLQLANKGRIP